MVAPGKFVVAPGRIVVAPDMIVVAPTVVACIDEWAHSTLFNHY